MEATRTEAVLRYELRPAGAVPLTRDEARALVEEIRTDTERLWLKLVDAYNRGCHHAMGYGSWRSFCRGELGLERNAAHRLLAAGQVMDELRSGQRDSTCLPVGDAATHSEVMPQTERVARELEPALHNGHVVETWEQTVERFGPAPTAAQTRQVVRGQEAKARDRCPACGQTVP